MDLFYGSTVLIGHKMVSTPGSFNLTPVTDMNMTVMTVRKECLFICPEEKVALNLAIQSAMCAGKCSKLLFL